MSDLIIFNVFGIVLVFSGLTIQFIPRVKNFIVNRQFYSLGNKIPKEKTVPFMKKLFAVFPIFQIIGGLGVLIYFNILN
ncbi:MAG: hypothetical protein ACPGTS_00725 [Minisyncoccia bacterium]